MPINFSQPEPIAPAVSAGAAAAEFAAKGFPQIAQIYENAARLRAQGGGGGGGGGGGPVYSGGPVQVLPTGDYGALAQVESQANRQQRAADLGAELQWDPVGRHIQMQEDFRRQQTEAAQAAQDRTLRQLNPDLFGGQPQQRIQQGPTPEPVVTFTPEDTVKLNNSGQAIADLSSRFANNEIPVAAYYQMREPLQQQYDQLTAKQRAANESQEREKHQAEMRQGMHQTALQVANGRGLLTHMPSAAADIPGMPPDRYMPDKNGLWHNVNKEKQIEMMKSRHSMQLEEQKAATKINEAKDTRVQYEKIRAMAERELKIANSGEAPSHEQIIKRMQEIRDHLDEWSGKKPQQQQRQGGTNQDYERLRDSLLGTAPHPSTPKAEVPFTATPPATMGGDHFGGFGSY